MEDQPEDWELRGPLHLVLALASLATGLKWVASEVSPGSAIPMQSRMLLMGIASGVHFSPFFFSDLLDLPTFGISKKSHFEILHCYWDPGFSGKENLMGVNIPELK